MNSPLHTVLVGDCRDVLKTLPDESVHCVVTSPPYHALRNYEGGALEIGRETSVDAYVNNLVVVFREVRRVLRADGTLWLNLGDKFVNKQVAGLPWKVAFALQADSWILRSDIIWEKPNAMPDSVQDRPTKSHEYVFLFTKSPKYFYDIDAVREPSTYTKDNPSRTRNVGGREDGFTRMSGGASAHTGGRNRRTVWAIPTAPFSAKWVGVENTDHFATFPPALVEPCILAGTSERGVCPHCGAGWRRVMEQIGSVQQHWSGTNALAGDFRIHRERTHARVMEAVGWQPACQCPPHDPIPATVLDPFAGSGTTLLTAHRLGRRSVGIELNPDYANIINQRILHNK